jgi:hypothetical protein
MFVAATPVPVMASEGPLPFTAPSDRPSYERALQCLTEAVYYEARSESDAGQRAVAQVVLNRVRHPSYPSSVCGVVYQGSERATGCQFTFTCDGALARTPHPALWRQARQIAEAALAGAVYKPVGWATHYHTNWVVPYWSSSLVKAAMVGTHIFYRWTGGWGTGPAFRTRYAGVEPGIAKMKHLSTVPPTPEELEQALAAAAGVVGADGTSVPALPLDLSQRPIIRRYEAAKAEDVAALVAVQARSSGTAASSSHRWALTGDGAASTEAPLGKPAEMKKTEAGGAKSAPPKELEGVRRIPGSSKDPTLQ